MEGGLTKRVQCYHNHEYDLFTAALEDPVADYSISTRMHSCPNEVGVGVSRLLCNSPLPYPPPPRPPAPHPHPHPSFLPLSLLCHVPLLLLLSHSFFAFNMSVTAVAGPVLLLLFFSPLFLVVNCVCLPAALFIYSCPY